MPNVVIKKTTKTQELLKDRLTEMSTDTTKNFLVRIIYMNEDITFNSDESIIENMCARNALDPQN